ncbi:ead/Ea22-like family protein [Citrobacter freundii]|uniref:ead/Ea22-like family protein n=1 Tax=Citrobacter freundii TaxID=546 RepID=UPI00190268F6|nr:ead/Ea22-like family protein [Citrobacter freundii]MBJ8974954.1 ead/Ea22-like family protein [Citrobacter freundii]MBJ9012386.1 ead/Ea22-like family protein [Citrobacter freundii]
MTALNKQALREAAEKALQGKWNYEAKAIWNTDESGWVQHMAAVDAGDDISDEEHKSNMQFITVVTPSVILDLLDELKESQTLVANESACANSTINLAINWQTRCKEAEVKLEATEKRIEELEARTVNLPAACADDEYFIDGVFQALRYERDVERAILAAGIGVKGE